jgi:hypothetical protein
MKKFDRKSRNSPIRISMWLGCSALMSLGDCRTSATENTVLLTTGPDYYPLTDIKKPDGGRATRIVSAVFKSLGKDLVIDC